MHRANEKLNDHDVLSLKDWYDEPERGSEWEPIKILLEGDRGTNKMNTASNTRLRLNYPSWSRPRSH
jgi:AAA+ superfamily predicted ATPase